MEAYIAPMDVQLGVVLTGLAFCGFRQRPERRVLFSPDTVAARNIAL
jgi:hypothetical protein